MSPTKLIRNAAVASLALFAVAASAAHASDIRSGAPPAWYAVNPGLEPMKLMHMMDADRSGTISREEFLKFHEELFDKLDTNHDGQIDAGEWMGRSASLAADSKGTK